MATKKSGGTKGNSFDAKTPRRQETRANTKRAAQKAVAVTKTPVTKTAVKKTSLKKAPVKKAPVKKTPVKKAPVKKAPVKKTPVKKTPVKKTPVKKAPVKKAPAKRPANPLVPKRRDEVSAAALPPLPNMPAGVLLGTHVSSQGGSFAAPPRATEIGATALQLFTKTPNQWKEREIDADEAAQFRAALHAAGSPVTVSHDSYLINLASPDDEQRARSLESFATELRRCHALGIDYLVSHPGNYMDDRDAGIARNAAAIAAALTQEPGPTILCLEATAGSGTALGATFEELAAIIAAVPAPLRSRIGICVDTCHIYSAGYDIVGDFDGVMATFDRVLGLERLRVWHLNDSKTPFNSHRDRHELIGDGSLGDAPFHRIMTDARFAHTVKILETPKLDDATRTDRTMLNRLLSFLSPA
jgi:deoxyribonuclease IV